MQNLEKYARQFPKKFGPYSDARYTAISGLISQLDQRDVRKHVCSKHFRRAVSLIQPLVAIKNFKSQTPFPQDIAAAVEAVLSIRTARVRRASRFDDIEDGFAALNKIEGFGVPTISAVLHFCHPHQFPIVDRNVLHACKILIDKYPREFAGYACPGLANRAAHVGVKLQRYEQFVCVIDRIIERHPPSPIKASYRAIDKALMVLGSPSKDEGDTLSAK